MHDQQNMKLHGVTSQKTVSLHRLLSLGQ